MAEMTILVCESTEEMKCWFVPIEVGKKVLVPQEVTMANMAEHSGLKVRNSEARDRRPVQELRQAIHDLCQPLTALGCRLELASLTESPEAYESAVKLGTVDCSRIAELAGRIGEIAAALESCADCSTKEMMPHS